MTNFKDACEITREVLRADQSDRIGVVRRALSRRGYDLTDHPEIATAIFKLDEAIAHAESLETTSE